MARAFHVPDDRRAIVTFVGLTMGISWSIWGLWSILPDPSPEIQTVAFAAGGFGPSIAAVVVLKLRGTAVRPWLRQLFSLQRRPRVYGAALLIPVLAVGVAGTVHVVFLGSTVALETVPQLWEYPLFLLFIGILGGGQEEPGWRGFLLPALQRQRSALEAALLVGVVWGVWHLPLFTIPGTIQSSLPVGLYAGQLVGLSVILTWLSNRAAGAVLPAVILHAGGNAVLNYYPVGGTAGATTATGFTVLTGTVIGIAVLVLIREGRSLGRSRGSTTDHSDTAEEAVHER